MNTQYRKNLKAVLEASKTYCDESIANLEWQIGTYNYDVATDSNVARIKTLPSDTYKSQIDYIGGKIVKYNQLINGYTSREIGGLTITDNEDGTVSISGTVTSTDAFSFATIQPQSFVAGHKYIIKSSNNTVSLNYLVGSSNVNFTDGAIFTYSSGQTLYISLKVTSGTTYNLTFGVELIDLTDTFGSGNEPSTVETAIPLLKANGYKLDGTDTYSTGSLKHAVVSAVKYWGINLFDIDNTAITPESVTYTINNDKSITIKNNEATEHRIGFNLAINKTISISFNTNSTNGRFVIATLSISNNFVNGLNKIENISYNNNYISFYINGGATVTISNIMINEGSTALPYIPYVAPITKAIPSEVLADSRYGLGYDNSNYNHLDSDGHLRGKRNSYTFTGNEAFLDRGTNQLGLQIYACDVASFMNYETPVSNITTLENYLGTTTSIADVQAGSDTKGFRLYENSSQPNTRFIYFIGYTLSQIAGVTIEYNQATSFDQDYSQYFDTNWNKEDLDKQYATCEMVVAEPIDMPNSITNLIKEVKA